MKEINDISEVPNGEQFVIVWEYNGKIWCDTYMETEGDDDWLACYNSLGGEDGEGIWAEGVYQPADLDIDCKTPVIQKIFICD